MSIPVPIFLNKRTLVGQVIIFCFQLNIEWFNPKIIRYIFDATLIANLFGNSDNRKKLASQGFLKSCLKWTLTTA